MHRQDEVPLADLAAEARRIVDGARQRGVTLRLLGGLAIRQHCQALPFCERPYSDIDVMGLKAQRGKIQSAFAELGYEPNATFNALHGNSRLEFIDSANDRHVDVFLDVFEMDHRIDLRRRLAVDDYTISVSDLFLSKIQIVRLNQKDVQDILTLLKDCAISHEDSPGTINADYIVDLCACDWGLWKTVTLNIEMVTGHVDDYVLSDEEKARIREQIADLKNRLVNSPKCLRWRLRALVGERVRWYEMVEEE
jgi:hypothetical protein